MKNLTYIFFLLVSSIVHGQSVSYKILGEIKDPGDNKFAYLYLFNSPDSNVALKCVPITNSRFSFEGKVDLNKRLVANAAIFLGISSSLTYQEIMATERASGNTKLCRMVAVEDLAIQINNANDLARAMVKGGPLNMEKDEVTKVSENGKYDDFLRTHPDSPASLTLLSALTYISVPLQLDKEYYLGIFNSFTLRLRTSPEGKALIQRIDSIN